jgi:hypothetical protein
VGTRPKKHVTTHNTREQRVSVRVTVDTYVRAAVFHPATGRTTHGWVRDLSSGGLFVDAPDRFDAEEAVIVDILARSGNKSEHLRVEGWVAHSHATGMGIQFRDLEPEMAGRLAEVIDHYR